jgi:hypothetical protein
MVSVSAMRKAAADCKALWADHAFDSLRDKIALEGKPSFAMLTNAERLRPQDKPVADLAVKTLEKCRAAYEPTLVTLPAGGHAMIQGLERKEDALNAELYSRKITFGEYNVAMNRLTGEVAKVLSGYLQTQASSAPAASESA